LARLSPRRRSEVRPARRVIAERRPARGARQPVGSVVGELPRRPHPGDILQRIVAHRGAVHRRQLIEAVVGVAVVELILS